jgi:hypothetical protein
MSDVRTRQILAQPQIGQALALEGDLVVTADHERDSRV